MTFEQFRKAASTRYDVARGVSTMARSSANYGIQPQCRIPIQSARTRWSRSQSAKVDVFQEMRRYNLEHRPGADNAGWAL